MIFGDVFFQRLQVVDLHAELSLRFRYVFQDVFNLLQIFGVNFSDLLLIWTPNQLNVTTSVYHIIWLKKHLETFHGNTELIWQITKIVKKLKFIKILSSI